MKIYPIPNTCGHERRRRMGVIVADRVVALSYLSSIGSSSVADQLEGPGAEFAISQWLRKSPMELCELQALGGVSVGIVSAAGFAEAWKVE